MSAALVAQSPGFIWLSRTVLPFPNLESAEGSRDFESLPDLLD
jgi:hypothetical protein